tara:strand:+ start:227 stop:415 length:189 start_codon:yes stop_codon:yes gene_type:complete
MTEFHLREVVSYHFNGRPLIDVKIIGATYDSPELKLYDIEGENFRKCEVPATELKRKYPKEV